MTRRNEDIYRTGFSNRAIDYTQTYRTTQSTIVNPDVERARSSPRAVDRASRPPTRTTGQQPRYPIPNTSTGTQRTTSTRTGQQPRRTTGGDPAKVYAVQKKTEKLPRQITGNFILTIIGMTLLCGLALCILLANIVAAWQNGQDASYFTQTARHDYAQVGNAQVWAFMAGSNVDVLILKNNDMAHARILVVAQVLKGADHTNLELVRSNDEQSVLLSEKGEHVGGLTFAPSQDTQTWKIDVEKEAVK